jgi:exonuclease SbcD
MKLIHFSDVHLGMENYSVTDAKTGISSRFLDFLKSLDFVVKYSLSPKNKIDLVLFTGDAYKTRDPSPTYMRAFAERIKRIADKLPVVLLVGNHDLPNTSGKANTLDIFSALSVPGVYVSKKPEIIEISAGDDILQIATLPWMNKIDLLGDTKDKTIEETNRLITRKLGEEISQLSKKIDLGKPAILAAHYSVAGALYGSEQGVMLGRDMAINIKDLKNTKFDYIALGHLHKNQIILQKPFAVYPGSIERIDFGEEKDKKGFIELTILKKKNGKIQFETSYKFIETPARKFTTLEILVNEKDNPTEKVISEIKKRDIADSIIKVNIKISQDKLEELKQSKVQKALSLAHFIAGLSIDISDMLKKETVTFYKEDYSWRDMLNEYFKKENVSKAREKKLIEAAEDLISEVEEDL